MRLIVSRFIVFGLLTLGVSGLTGLAQPGAGSSQLNLRWKPVPIEKDELAEAMLHVERGTLVQLSPREFQLLQTATVQDPSLLHPKVIAAKYRARYAGELNGEANLSGTAEWVVRRPPSSLAIVSLEGLQVAIRQAKWSDGVDAILYKRSTDSVTRLYLPEGNQRTLNLEWSTRGINEPGEIRFSVGVPSFPVATLELDLPLGLTPVLPQAEAMLTGPFPAGSGEHAWRIAFGGISRLEIVLRRTSETSTPIISRSTSTQSLNGSEATARFEFQVESAKTGFTELRFAHDSSFIPTSVTANNLVNWSPVTEDPSKPSILVRLREPTRSAAVVISGVAAASWSPVEWRIPRVHLVDGIVGSERLLLSIGPTLELLDARLNDFELVKSEQGADRSYLLELEPTLRPSSGQPRQGPVILVSRRGHSLWATHQQSVWNVGRDEERLEVLTSVASSVGTPRVLRFEIPGGWQVDRVERNNREASWSVSTGSKNILEIDLGPSLKKVDFVTHLRRSRPEVNQETLAIPDLFPVGGSSRAGILKIVVDPALEATLSDPIPNLSATPSSAMTRELSSFPQSGHLSLSRAQPRHRIDVENRIQASRSGMTIASTLSISSVSGSVREISLWTPSLVNGDWEWRDESGRWVAQAVRSPIDDAGIALGGLLWQPVLSALATRSALSFAGGHHWKLRFSRPIVRDTKLFSICVPSAQESRLPLPIPRPVGVPFSGTVLSPFELIPSQREPSWSVAASAASGEFEYRYGERRSSSNEISRDAQTPEFRDLRTIQSIDDQGTCRVTFTFQVRRWARGNLPLTLPEGVSEPETRIAGRPAPTTPPAQTSRLLEISVPSSNSWTSVELRYQLPLHPGFLTLLVPGLTPEGPFDQESVRGLWEISPSWRPHVPSNWQAIPGTIQSRQDLPAPDWRAFLDRAHLVPLTLMPELAIVDTLALSHADTSGLDTIDLKSAYDADPKRIVVVERRDGKLITTREMLDHWRFEAGWFEFLPKEVDRAISEALQLGSDASGRFVSLEHWDSKSINRESPFDAETGWCLYEESGHTRSVRLFHRDRVSGISWLLSIVVVGGILMLARGRLRDALLVFGLSAGCACWLVFPVLRHEVAGPALFVFAVAFLIGLFLTSCATRKAPTWNSGLRAGATLASMVFLVSIGTGADSSSTQVSEIRDRDGKTNSYLVPTSLIERTREANGQTPHGPVIVAANYMGTRTGKTAELRASYRVHCFEGGVGQISIPILGARFRSVTLDGAEARDVDASSDGLRVAVVGKGDHTLELQFTIGINSSTNERELKFSVPEVPISRLSFALPGSATPLQLGGWRGAVAHSAIPGGQKLEADLGSTSTISVRWTEDSGVKVTTRVKQASVWQITPQSATLSGLIEYRISGGGVSSFQLAIPGNSEVSRLAIRADSTSTTAASARIRDWSLGQADANGERTLTIQTLSPISNRVIFSLELMLSTALRQNSSLSFPRPLGVVESEFFAATNLDNLEEQLPTKVSGLTEASIDSFVREVWSSLDGSPYSGKITAAYRADGKMPPQLGLTLRSKLIPRTVSESLSWWVEPERLLVVAQTRWKGTAISSVEWTLPTDLTVTEITGKGVASWTQLQGKVRVWLDSPINELALNWLAMRNRPSKDATSVTIPPIAHVSASNIATQTEVRSANGWSLSPSERTLPGKVLPPRLAGELTWITDRPASVTLIAHAPQANLVPTFRTTMKPINDRVQSASEVNLETLVRDRPHLIRVRVDNCADCTVEVLPPAPWKISEGAPRPSERYWDIAIPANHVGPRTLNVVATSREQDRNSWLLPRISVSTSSGNQQSAHHVLLVDPSTINMRPEFGLTRNSATEWRVVDRDWKATASLKTESPRNELVRIAKREIFVERLGGSWHYRAHYALVPGQSGLLRIAAPTGATLHACEVNGHAMSIENGDSKLQVETVTQSISAFWSSPEPQWDGLRLAFDGTEFTVPENDWRVRVPAGWTLELPSEPFTVGHRIVPSKVDSESRSSGLWHEFRVLGSSTTHPKLLPPTFKNSIWVPLVAGSLLLGLAALTLLVPSKSKALQAALVALLAAIVLGPSAGIFLLIPLLVAVVGCRRLLTWLARQFRPRDLAGATS